MPNDDLTQQLAEIVNTELDSAWDRSDLDHLIAQAVLASGLVVPRTDYDDKLDLIRKLSDEFVRNDVVPTSAVLDLAVDMLRAPSAYTVVSCAAELRALTRQENQ